MRKPRSNILHIVRIAAFLLVLCMGLAPSIVSAKGLSDSAVIITLGDGIDPNHARYLDRALDKAEASNARVVIVRIDTPGGLLDSTRKMVQRILDSRVPVVTYVSPPGARAGSAGAFVAAAGNISAMAPTTNIGAATPISGSGNDLPSTLKSKVTNDSAALMRSIAETRGRNSELLEKTVTQAASYTAQEALAGHVIDIVATDYNDLLRQIDGKTVTVGGGRQVTLDTDGISCVGAQQACINESLTWFEKFINFIADPNVSGLLLLLGSIGLLIEIFSPGLVVPGVVGAIMLALAFIAFGNLPVNWAGVGLIILGIVLAGIELHVAGFGVFGVCSIISLIVGTLFLFAPFSGNRPNFSGPDVSVSKWVVIGVSSGLGAFLLGTGVLAWRGKKVGLTGVTPSDARTLVGQKAVVRKALTPSGIVYAAGEEWSAHTADGSHMAEEAVVEITGIDGLSLTVIKIPDKQ